MGTHVCGTGYGKSLLHDRALIFLNSIAIFVFASGLITHYYAKYFDEECKKKKRY